MNSFYNSLLALASNLTSEGCPSSGATVLITAGHLWDWMFQLSDGTDNYRWCETDTLLWINDNWPTDGAAYELTMEDMLAKIWGATPLETFFFINYIDGMRASIWNIEIKEEKLSEIYRHFLP